MAVQIFIAGSGPYYRLTGSPAAAPGQALLSSADGVARWGDVVPTQAARVWAFQNVPVYAAGEPATALRMFVNEELVDDGRGGPRPFKPLVSVFAEGFLLLNGLGAPSLTFEVPGGRFPYGDDPLAVPVALSVDSAPYEAGTALFKVGFDPTVGEVPVVEITLPVVADDRVEVSSIAFTFIGRKQLPPP